MRPIKTQEQAHIIVFGNEKGGSGKSTAAMHTAIALLRLGYKVGSLDLDARQGTFTRYLKKRFDFITSTRDHLPSPTHLSIPRSTADSVTAQEEEERTFLSLALQELGRRHHFIVIDTPGTDSHLSRLAHGYADTLITPMNDSFIDLDVLVDIDPDTLKIKGPSVYAQMVQDLRRKRQLCNAGDLDWIVMRNRLASLNARNKQVVGDILQDISGTIGFRLALGFGERVIFREMFLKGLTLLDIKEGQDKPLTLSQLTARQEVRNLVVELAPEKLKGRVRPVS